MKRIVLLTALLATATLARAQQMPVTTASDAARAEFMLGRTALANLDNDAALRHFDAALATDPQFATAHFYRAAASADGRDEHMRHAAAGSASDGERDLIQAYSARLAGDTDRERTLLTTVTQRFATDPYVWLSLANSEQGNGNPAAAVAAAHRGIAADPTFAPLYNSLGYAEMAQGHMAEAEAAFLSYIRLAPNEFNPYDSYGEYLLAAGRLDEAQAQYEMALTKNPTYDPDGLGLARVGIAQADQRFEQAVAAGDADAIAALYTASAVAMPPDSPPVVGRAAIRTYMAGLVASGIRDVDIQTVEIARYDNMALQRATITITMPSGVVEHGKSLVIWRLVNGQWMYNRDMWSMNGPAPTSTH